MSKDEALMALNKYMSERQFMIGDSPSSVDTQMWTLLNSQELTDKITTALHPRLFGWNLFISNFAQLTKLGWSDPAEVSSEITLIIEALKQETDKDGDERREKAKWDNYVPAADRRPLDEFADVQGVEAEVVPIDISDEQDGQMMKYIVKHTTSKFDRIIAEADIV